MDTYHKLALRDLEFLITATGAEADAATTLRTIHRDKLAAEIQRSCGVHEDGSAPDECGPATQSGMSAPAGEQTILDVLADSRSNSALLDALRRGADFTDPYEVELVTAVDGGLVLALRNLGQAWSNLVPAQPTPVDGENLLEGCEEDIKAALKAEYGLIYSFGVATTALDKDLKVSATTSADRHRLLRDRTIAILEGAGVSAPLADPGYTTAGDAPDVKTAAAEFASAAETDCANAWQKVAMHAKDPQMRLFAIQSAGLAAAGSSVFAGAPEEPLPGLEASLG